MNDDSIIFSELVVYKSRIKTLEASKLLNELIRVAKKAESTSPDDISNHKVAICSNEILKRISGIDLRAS